MSLDSPSTRKCLAFHGPLLYEARILHRYDPATGTITSPDSTTTTTTSTAAAATPPPPVPPELAAAPCFYIHYQGWKATWDEWVAPERLREDTPANRELRKQLARDARAAKETRPKESRPKEAREPRAGARGGRGRRAAQGSGASGASATATTGEGGSGDASPPAEDYAARVQQAAQRAAPRLQLHMPVPLKAVLVDDWEQVTKNKRVAKLPPRAPRLSVAALLQRYRADALRGDGDTSPPSLVQQSLLEEYLRGLAEYFDAALPRLLLYRLERLQLAQLTQGKSADSGDALPPRALYGSVHLLRLLSVLPELLGGTAMGAGDSRVLLRQSEALLVWLAVHRDELFPGEGGESADVLDSDGDGYYVNTSSQYEGVAIGM
ncbi:Eaf3 protein [Maudiozyma humilis]|uniref:Chromatin modification-related protein EAF3 n=1 Tax=Maudiozyma humilis TaxID=51915 RepID=A0AAV5RU02_MAUHU|nr:Eaf3 protein [Kazachstania humilis]